MSYGERYTPEQLDEMLNRAQDKIQDQEDIIEALLAQNRRLQGRLDVVAVDENLAEIPLSEVEREIQHSIRLLRQELNADGLSRPYGRLRRITTDNLAEPAKEERVQACEQRVMEVGKQLLLAVCALRSAEMDAYPESGVDWEEVKREMYERGILPDLGEA